MRAAFNKHLQGDDYQQGARFGQYRPTTTYVRREAEFFERGTARKATLSDKRINEGMALPALENTRIPKVSADDESEVLQK